MSTGFQINAVQVGSVGRLPASRVVRSAPPRVVAPWRRTEVGSPRAPNGPDQEAGARGRLSTHAGGARRDGIGGGIIGGVIGSMLEGDR